jgi:prepilin-type N-terminal cleavage/methylation domain-containing protein
VSKRGFTLIEVIVALVVGGMAVSAAAALLTGLGERVNEIRSAGARVDRDGNAERLVRDLLQNLRFSGDSTRTVSGDSAAMVFLAWCESVEGWLRPCTVRLTVADSGARFHFALALNQREPSRVILWEGERLPRQSVGIRYLRDPLHGGVWSTRWTEIVAPAAIQLFAGNDTLLFSIW